VARDARPFVLLDAEEEEVVAIAASTAGRLFALAARAPGKASPRPPEGAGPPVEGASVTVRVTAPAEGEGVTEAEPDARPKPPSALATPQRPGAVLYRIDPDGGVWRIWESSQDVPYALALDREGSPLLATGDRGKLLRLDPEGRITRMLRFPSEKATAVVADVEGRVVVGGSADARVAEIGPELSREGSFVTEVLDAGSVARWGRVAWDAETPRGARLAVRVRSGNTAEPDETWSEWSGVDPDGDTRAPAARWLQAEVRMMGGGGGTTPLLRSIEVHYQPRNRPPRIDRLAVGVPGEAWSRQPQQSAFGGGPVVAEDPISRKVTENLQSGRKGAAPVRKQYEAGVRTASWSAADPDGDPLVYSLELRPEGAEGWLPLASAIQEDFYSWDGRGLSDGRYRLRLTAQDGRFNAEGQGFAVTRVSDPFVVDNTPPQITHLEVREASGGFEVRFRAQDSGGRVAAAEVGHGDGPWSPIDPEDGVADSEVEEFRLHVPAASLEGLRLRVTDASGNVAAAPRRLAGPTR
jgi:hypothetical protein